MFDDDGPSEATNWGCVITLGLSLFLWAVLVAGVMLLWILRS